MIASNREWTRSYQIKLALDELKRLQRGLITLAEREADTILPGFTHLQVAMPVTIATTSTLWAMRSPDGVFLPNSASVIGGLK